MDRFRTVREGQFTLVLELYGGESARPARFFIANPSGERQLPSVFETSRRAAWRKTYGSIVRAESEVAHIRAFAEDVHTVLALGLR